MAPGRISAVLAEDVTPTRSTANTRGTPAAHRRYGDGQSNWGEERIAAELRVELGITVSPRTIRRYMPRHLPTRGGRAAQSSATFLQNHAGAVLACDFFVVVTATFRRVYVFVMLDVATRRVVHCNTTAQPTADWTIQQCRDGLPLDGPSWTLVHDRDAIFSPAVDEALTSMQVRVLKARVRTPQANAHCERFIGTARRECLDWIIPLGEQHLRRVLTEWIRHYNGDRPHSALGPGRPDDPLRRAAPRRHDVPDAHRVRSRSVLGGLHHEYRLEPLAA